MANKLSEKQKLWARYFLNPDPELGTFFNATRSAEKAGYAGEYQSHANAGHSNRNSKMVQAYMDKLYKEQFDSAGITVEKVLSDLELTRMTALQRGELSVARQCSHDQGKYLKMFVDRIEQVQTVEEASTGELAQLLRYVIDKIDDPDITEILKGPSGTVTRAGDIVPTERNKATN